MSKLVYPFEQSPEYAFNCIPSVHSWHDPRVCSSVAMYVTLLAIATGGLYRLAGHRFSRNCVVSTSSFSPDSRLNASHKRDSVLHSLMLLLVFFLPASGLVFRLGTLLAERLMYMPSLGACLLLAGTGHYLCFRIVKNIRSVVFFAESLSAKNCGRFISCFLYACLILLVTYAYIERATAYNKVWWDDETLFVESLKVCPQSAKMNLQVSKVWSQRGYLKRAKLHLDRAKSIDPDFCDTGYQDAILTLSMLSSTYNEDEDEDFLEINRDPAVVLMHDKKRARAASGGINRNGNTGGYTSEALEAAAAKAVQNLHCIYTNTQTYTMLHQIWSAQLETAAEQLKHGKTMHIKGKKNPMVKALETQGEQAAAAEVYFLAVQKFMDAANHAYDATQTTIAINLTGKAAALVSKLELRRSLLDFDQERHGSHEDEVSAEQRCRVFSLGGCYRAPLTAALSGSSFEEEATAITKSKKAVDLLLEGEIFLRRAVHLDCLETLISSDVAGSIQQLGVANQFWPVAVNHLVSLLNIKVITFRYYFW
jgi:hypothetical protein